MGKKTGWWDEECKEMKREVRGKLRDWRKRGEGERDSIRSYAKRKRRKNGRWEKRVMEAKRVNELWEIVNKERRARKRVSENIEMEVWKEHFMRLRRGVECRVVKGERRGEGAGVFEEKIGREEIRRVIGKIKDGKT